MDKLQRLLEELNAENDRHTERIYKISKAMEELLKAKSITHIQQYGSRMEVNRLHETQDKSDKLVDFMMSYQKESDIDRGQVKLEATKTVQNSSLKTIQMEHNLVQEETKTSDKNFANNKSSKQEKTSAKNNLLFPDSVYTDYIEHFKSDFRSWEKLNLDDKFKESIGFISSYDQWLKEKQMREEIVLVEEIGMSRYYAKPEILNEKQYYLLGYNQVGPFLKEGDIIRYAIDIFFEMDIDVVLSGKPVSMERPAVLEKVTDGSYVLKEKGKFGTGR